MEEKNIKKSSLQKTFKVKVPYIEIKKSMDVEFESLSKSLKVPGFRPGKVPLSFVKNKYFKEVINKTSEKLIQEEGNKNFEKNNYRLAFQPKVKLLSELKENVDLEAEYIFEILPTFTLNDFSKIKLEKYTSSISENDIDNVIKKLHRDNVIFKKAPSSRLAKKNDRLVINYKGFLGEEQFQGGTAENQIIDLGNNSYLPEFEKNLIGKKVKQEFNLDIVFPKNYHAENLREKKATFKISVNEISIPEPLKDDSALASKMGAKNVNELKEKIKNELTRYSGELSFAILKNQIIKNIVDDYKFELPPTLVEREVEIIKSNYNKGKPANNDKEKNVDKKILKEAENKVKIGIVLSEIGVKHKINITNQEIETELARICMQYPGKEKEIVEFYKNNPAQMNSLKSPIFENKVIKLISEKASVKEQKVSSEELNSKIATIEKEMGSNIS
ncbi:MAG: Trigger factor [Alphaproteobacteria bacterium MarineAlpha9_Bin4]|nr:trigger factor [Pelagibacterales bacterium]PPR25189.1 MAG: Trigger factor [Alphaproteobacteria bacterium MarineAlpha9_Bin4]|tara:strand:- start:4921 stop:6255 length:1335 start_codon:yes stop_codon:yes gene_type:complete